MRQNKVSRGIQLMFLLVSFTGCVRPLPDASLEKQLLGQWKCKKGYCPDPVIRFEAEGGQNVYSSWLHDRPAAVSGEWSIDGKRLQIKCCAGLSSQWTIIRLDSATLILQEQNTDETAELSRTPE